MAEETGDERGEYGQPRRLQRLPSWLAGQLARKAEQLVAEALAQEGARRPHFAVLTSLAEQGPASQAALGRRLWIDRSDLHAIVAELERGGLVARARDEADRRRNVVTITPAGSVALSRLTERVESAQQALLAPLSAGERSELLRLLRLLITASGD